MNLNYMSHGDGDFPANHLKMSYEYFD